MHCQLRIRVECAFGMLVQRWRILQSALPRGVTIQKSIALVNALAKLHNFCINQVREVASGIPDVLPLDARNVHGEFIILDEVENADVCVPTALLGGGDHFNDVPLSQRRPRNATEHEKTLPRYRLLQQVIESHMVRPHVNVQDKNK